MQSFRSSLIGDRAFYKRVFSVSVPIVIQYSVNNIVNLLDNIMVGQLGNEQMAGVAVAGQLVFIFFLCVFGGLAGPGIFGAQFYGAGDTEGLKNTFRLKVWIGGILVVAASLVMVLFGQPLMRLFLTGEGDPASAAKMLSVGQEYLLYLLPGHLPFALAMCYASTLRETGETMLPMKASIAAVLTNLFGNWVLIFGHLGLPALGVRGAAIATVISRLVELSILLLVVRKNPQFSFFKGIYRTLKVPFQLLTKVLKKGLPLLVNEFFWSLGMTTLTQSYSMRALIVMSGLSISSSVTNLFNVFFLSIGNAVGIIVGQTLGSGDLKKAREDANKMLFLTFVVCLFVGSLMALLSGLFPRFYNTSQEARDLAAGFILISALYMPINAVTNSCYFTLRSGGSTLITFLFDSAFTWLFMIPVTLFLVHKTQLPILPLYLISQGSNLVKCAIGLLLVRSGRWQKNIVEHSA